MTIGTMNTLDYIVESRQNGTLDAKRPFFVGAETASCCDYFLLKHEIQLAKTGACPETNIRHKKRVLKEGFLFINRDWLS